MSDSPMIERTYPKSLRHLAASEPLLTVLNFSGGVQSTALLWMLIRGDVDLPANLIVLNADAGMEHRSTYASIRRMFALCDEAGIDWAVAPGPSLYADVINLADNPEKARIDNPALFVDKGDGEVGQLMQKCTKYYKISPMDRVVRAELDERYSLGRDSTRLGVNTVEKWIGLCADEEHRVKKAKPRYQHFRYPLIEMGWTKADVLDYYAQIGEEVPARSVCVGCWANGFKTYQDMMSNGSDDLERAIAFDRAVRDLTQVGVEYPCYVSRSMRPLDDLVASGFGLGDPEGFVDQSCDSGYCFT